MEYLKPTASMLLTAKVRVAILASSEKKDSIGISSSQGNGRPLPVEPLSVGRRTFCLGPHYAAKPNMTCRGVDVLALPGCRAVAKAKIRGAEVRATLDHLARDCPSRTDRREAGIRQLLHWIAWCATWAGRSRGTANVVSVPCPFPDVADHVEQPVSVGWERADRRR